MGPVRIVMLDSREAPMAASDHPDWMREIASKVLGSGTACRPRLLWTGDCPIMGLGSFGILTFWGQKRRRCMGPPMPTIHAPVNEL